MTLDRLALAPSLLFAFVTLAIVLSARMLFVLPRSRKNTWITLGNIFANIAITYALITRSKEIGPGDFAAVLILNGLFLGIFIASRYSTFSKDLQFLSIPTKLKTSSISYFKIYLYFSLAMIAWAAVSIFIFGKFEPKWGPIGNMYIALTIIQPIAVLYLLGTAIGRAFIRNDSPMNTIVMASLMFLGFLYEANSIWYYLSLPVVFGLLDQLIPINKLIRRIRRTANLTDT